LFGACRLLPGVACPPSPFARETLGLGKGHPKARGWPLMDGRERESGMGTENGGTGKLSYLFLGITYLGPDKSRTENRGYGKGWPWTL
jgi:hypothetical protein